MIGILLNVIPIIATVFLIICYFPQIIKTYKTKDVTGISLSFFVMLNIALTLLLVNSILLFTVNGNFGYVVTYIFNEGLAFIMLVFVLKYRKKDK
ncbi:PQ loop repeat protein [Bacillus phage vB_BcoS-136]|uniref:PQ loop repeat protein n=1 Tax=Bacillus phage vB_BcoS-136 TaxID=2419619 RepID=A0A3G3BVK4_9CAUD|nr:PQ loop repeat protein [Bacillus phage vB_BcoS-136]AYP68302.1 PQ loop repeat protein [Bacillus phage vB_BcoS-136]